MKTLFYAARLQSAAITGVANTAKSIGPIFQVRLCSDCCRWVQASVVQPTAMKRPLGTASRRWSDWLL